MPQSHTGRFLAKSLGTEAKPTKPAPSPRRTAASPDEGGKTGGEEGRSRDPARQEEVGMNGNAPPRKTFRTRVALRWSDLDAFNHVNNSRYLTFLERARVDASKVSAGLGDRRGRAGGRVGDAEFPLPIAYPAARCSWSCRPPTSAPAAWSSTTASSPPAAPLHCDGHVVAVWVDRRDGKPTELPPGVRRAGNAAEERIDSSLSREAEGEGLLLRESPSQPSRRLRR